MKGHRALAQWALPVPLGLLDLAGSRGCSIATTPKTGWIYQPSRTTQLTLAFLLDAKFSRRFTLLLLQTQ